MTIELSTNFGDLIAQRIKAAHREIAQRWLGQLEALLSVRPNDIFPTEQILDHIPALIVEIADYVGAEPADPLVANTLAFAKARELGELRFAQKASVHQLLREYRILGTVLGAFVQEQADARPPSSPAADVIAVVNRLSEAVFVLLQTTVDAFVGRYTDQIDEQTTRLEGFNRMIGHELRQPLSSVQTAIALLGTPAAEPAEKRAHFLEVADRNVQRLGRLLDMLGALARPAFDNPQRQEVELSKLVEDVFEQLGEVAQEKNVALRHTAMDLTLTLDVSRMELVLVNLVSNGIKYRDPSKPDAFVEVSAVAADGRVQLQVRDNGLGIPAEDQPRVFRRFFRAHESLDHELGNDGDGLGLAFAAECVKAMHGTLTFESTEGAGTTFSITLPTR